jgi:hypothetical protein
MTWKQITRRHLNDDYTYQDGRITLYKPARTRVTRDRYRGARIPTPWTTADQAGTGASPPTQPHRPDPSCRRTGPAGHPIVANAIVRPQAASEAVPRTAPRRSRPAAPDRAVRIEL